MEVSNADKKQAGFSLLELIISLGVVLAVLSIASAMLAQSFNVRAREDTRSVAIADAQRALNAMSREIANAGFGLTSNGLVAANSGAAFIRMRANLNAFMKEATSNVVTDRDEDVAFQLSANPDAAGNALVRSDINQGTSLILSSRIDTLSIRYLDASGTVVTPDIAARVEITISVTLPQIGNPGSANYQPASSVQLVSNVALRNSNLMAY